MNKSFYFRLAGVNLKKNAKIYIPYILTCIGTIMMFYILLFIAKNDGLSVMKGSDQLKMVMNLGSIVIGIFSVIILLYTNSFLIKRRKKELGLFNILGMEKKHIAGIMAIESLYVSVFSLVFGICGGILFSKLMLMLLLKLLKFKIPFGFEISPFALTVTLCLFAAIFLLTLLRNLSQVHLAKPVELLSGGNTGEREPKTKRLLAAAGVLSLTAGYTIAIITKSPIDALMLFFVAVVLVIIGTYCLFTAGSIALLKKLRKNKTYYYQTKHFTSVSGMLYRMKQNAVGLANICILSTIVLVMLSSTTSLYFGMEDALRNMYPRNIEITAENIAASGSSALEASLDKAIAAGGIKTKDTVKYRFINYSFKRKGNRFTYDRKGVYAKEGNTLVFFIPLAEYNRMQGSSAKLAENELLIYSPNSSFKGKTVLFGDAEYKVKAAVSTLHVEKYSYLRLTETIYFILPDEQAIAHVNDRITAGREKWKGLSYYYGFDVDGTSQEQKSLAGTVSGVLSDFRPEHGKNTAVSYTCAEQSKTEFLSIYGGLFFLGIFLGMLFMMAAVLIMYYKQISEGYDDKSRFEIMQKVGMSRDEVKKAIRSQVLTVFFLPLAAAGIHIAAAFKMITRLLAVLNLTNEALFAWCTVGTILVFAVFYAVIYSLTARAYYKIVE